MLREGGNSSSLRVYHERVVPLLAAPPAPLAPAALRVLT
jgi:hypothetical protein